MSDLTSLRNGTVTIVTETDMVFNHSHDDHHFNSTFISVQTGNGFFIDSEYIVTASHLVLADTYTSEHTQIYRAPAVSESEFVKVSRIYVHVFNVKCNKSYIYAGQLVGVDGAGDIAIVKINKCQETLPSLKYQPYFCFGKSKCTEVGSTAIVFGNPLFEDFQSVSSGIVRNNKYNQMSGEIVAESMLVTAPILRGNSGGPITNRLGEIIGMVAWEEAPGLAGGPSQRFMKPVVKALVKADKGCCQHHVQVIHDPLGNFFRYLKGYMGVGWNVTTAIDLSINFETGLSIAPPTDHRRIIGMSVRFVDDGIDSGVISPFINDLVLGDVITHIEYKKDCKHEVEPLGNLEKQITPTLVTWRKLHGDKIKMKFRKIAESFNVEHEVERELAIFPEAYDKPFYGVANSDVTPPKKEYIIGGKKMKGEQFLNFINEKTGGDFSGKKVPV